MYCLPLIALLLGIGVAGCRGNPAVPDLAIAREGEPLQTDRLEYTATRLEDNGPYSQYGFAVEVEYRNTTDEPLWLGRCYPDSETPKYGVEATEAGEAAYDQAWACVGHDEQFLIPPGDSRTDVLLIRGPNAWGGCTAHGCLDDHAYHGTLQGRFRLRYDVRLCGGDCYERAPDELRISNEFVVRVE